MKTLRQQAEKAAQREAAKKERENIRFAEQQRRREEAENRRELKSRSKKERRAVRWVRQAFGLEATVLPYSVAEGPALRVEDIPETISIHYSRSGYRRRNWRESLSLQCTGCGDYLGTAKTVADLAGVFSHLEEPHQVLPLEEEGASEDPAG